MKDKTDVLKEYESYLLDFDISFKKNVHNTSTSLEKKIFEDALKCYIENIKNILLILKQNNQIENYNFISKRISSDFKSRGLSKLEILIHRKLDNQ